MQKRALSNIVVTVLIVLLALAAIAIVWNVIGPMLKKTGEGIRSETEYLAIGFIVKDVEQDKSCSIKFTLERKAGGGDVSGFIVVLEDKGGISKAIYDYENTSVSELQTIPVDISYIKHGLCLHPNDANNKIKKIKVYADIPDADPSDTPGDDEVVD